MKKLSLILLLISTSLLPACDVLDQVVKEAGPPSVEEMTNALKQALQIGTENASSYLHQPGGYLDNDRFKIPFPPDVVKVADKLRELGFNKQVDEFIERMNRGAEDAAQEAAPIFVNAITSMTISDAKTILLGADNSATMYFKDKTTQGLYTAFAPRIKTSLDKYEVTKYWSNITSIYNKLPFVKPVETDLVKYATNKALDGLFLKLSDEEKDIRNNFAARTTPLLKKVFGWAQAQKL